jgi:hypothetical protein
VDIQKYAVAGEGMDLPDCQAYNIIHDFNTGLQYTVLGKITLLKNQLFWINKVNGVLRRRCGRSYN